MEREKDKQEKVLQAPEEPRQERMPYSPPKLVRFGDMKNITLENGGGGCGCSCAGA